MITSREGAVSWNTIQTPFFALERLTDRIQVTCNAYHLGNIYNHLYERGFRVKPVEGGIRVFYQEGEKEEQTTTYFLLNFFLKELHESNWFSGPVEDAIITKFTETRVFKLDGLMTYYLTPRTTHDEAKHQEQLTKDTEYRHTFRRKLMEHFFTKYQFEQTIDLYGLYSKNNAIHFKQIEGQDLYLVFVTVYYNSESGEKRYDAYLAKHQPNSQPKRKELDPQEEKLITEDFDPTKQMNNLVAYLEEWDKRS